VTNCDIEDRSSRETFYRFRTEMRKAPGSSGGKNPGPGVKAEAGIFAAAIRCLNGPHDSNFPVPGL